MFDGADTPHCRLVKARPAAVSKQGLHAAPGISAASAGAEAIHLQVITIPPLGRARAHLHEAHESALYALSGVSVCRYGAALEHEVTVEPGDFLYIPAGTPHLPYNPHESEPCVVVVARTDPNEQESVRLLPALDAACAAALDPRLRPGS